MQGSWLRKIIRGLSLTSALFVFQACYGTPQDFGNDLHIKGIVTAKTSGLPIKGIKVSVVNDVQYYFTDDEGQFSLYTEWLDNVNVKFEDIDSSQNGLFRTRDTVLTNVGKQVSLNIKMEDF